MESGTYRRVFHVRIPPTSQVRVPGACTLPVLMTEVVFDHFYLFSIVGFHGLHQFAHTMTR
jgi:hypothetical protein